jgi:MFS family permease
VDLMADDRAAPPLPRAVWVLSWVSFFADVSGEMVYPLLPLFLVGVLGSTKTELGLIEGSAVLIVALMSAVAGFRSDRLGRRVPWIRWGYGLPVAGKAVIALASGWPLVLGGRLLDRFGKGLRGAPRDALISDAVTADRRGRAFGLHRAFDTAGAFAGVMLSALLLWRFTGTPRAEPGAESQAPEWAYRAVFGVGAALGLASLALTFLVRESEPAPAADAVAAKNPPSSMAGHVPLQRSYWWVLAVLVLFSLANSSDTFLLLRVRDFGWSPWAVVLAYALYNVTYAALSYPAGVVSDRLGRWGVIGVGWVVYAAVYAGFAFLPPSLAWGVWPLMAVYGVYMALTDGVGKALIADHTPRERRGAAMGLFYAATGVTTLGASLLAGELWDHAGAAAALAAGSGFAVLALVALPFAIRRSAT